MKRMGLAVLLVVALASPTMAGTVTLSGTTYASAGGGGEFTFTVNGGSLDISHYSNLTSNISGSPSFQTFCVEHNEYIQQGYTYNFGALSDSAVLGGNGGPSDPISVGTAWLYSQFATGGLAGYTWSGSGRNTSAGDLQAAIWWLDDEGAGVKNGFVLAAETALGLTDTTVKADAGTNNFGVYVLNLQNVDGQGCANGYPGPNCQSQLVYVPDGGATLALLGGALIGLGALRRKFRA